MRIATYVRSMYRTVPWVRDEKKLETQRTTENSTRTAVGEGTPASIVVVGLSRPVSRGRGDGMGWDAKTRRSPGQSRKPADGGLNGGMRERRGGLKDQGRELGRQGVLRSGMPITSKSTATPMPSPASF